MRPSDSGDLQQLAPGGEIKHGTVKEATYKYAIASTKIGKSWLVTDLFQYATVTQPEKTA